MRRVYSQGFGLATFSLNIAKLPELAACFCPDEARRGEYWKAAGVLSSANRRRGWSDVSRGAMAAPTSALFRRARARPTSRRRRQRSLPLRENGEPFAFVLNQVEARSARLNGAAGSLGERAVALKMADVLALPAIVLRNDQQDALGVGLGVTEYAPRGKSAEEIRGLWRWA
jgi:hypothetical protein